MKVAELRAELASHGLDTKGKKAELEARLQALETAVLGADGADASTCIAAPDPPTKTTVAELRAELASRGLDTKGKKAELEARLLEPETSAAQLTAELRDLKAEHEAKLAERTAKNEAKVAELLYALETEHKAALGNMEAEHGAKEAALAAALVAQQAKEHKQQAKEHKAREFEEWREKINDASFDGCVCPDFGPAGAGAVAAIVASGKGALLHDIESRATDLVDTDVAALAEHCGELSSIDLDHCAHLTNAAVVAFADACRRRAAAGCGQLGSISFCGCNLIDNGALGAVGTLKDCGVKVEHTIGEVWVSCNECEEFCNEWKGSDRLWAQLPPEVRDQIDQHHMETVSTKVTREGNRCGFGLKGCSATICSDCSGTICTACEDRFCKECAHHMLQCDGTQMACYFDEGYDDPRGCEEMFCKSCAKDHGHGVGIENVF